MAEVARQHFVFQSMWIMDAYRSPGDPLDEGTIDWIYKHPCQVEKELGNRAVGREQRGRDLTNVRSAGGKLV